MSLGLTIRDGGMLPSILGEYIYVNRGKVICLLKENPWKRGRAVQNGNTEFNTWGGRLGHITTAWTSNTIASCWQWFRDWWSLRVTTQISVNASWNADRNMDGNFQSLGSFVNHRQWDETVLEVVVVVKRLSLPAMSINAVTPTPSLCMTQAESQMWPRLQNSHQLHGGTKIKTL